MINYVTTYSIPIPQLSSFHLFNGIINMSILFYLTDQIIQKNCLGQWTIYKFPMPIFL